MSSLNNGQHSPGGPDIKPIRPSDITHPVTSLPSSAAHPHHSQPQHDQQSAVETDLMSVLADWVARGPHLVANVFGERNHQIGMLKQQVDSLRTKISEECYQADRIKCENNRLRTGMDQLNKQIDFLKVENEQLQVLPSPTDTTSTIPSTPSTSNNNNNTAAINNTTDSHHKQRHPHPSTSSSDDKMRIRNQSSEITRLRQNLEGRRRQIEFLSQDVLGFKKECDELKRERDDSIHRLKGLENWENKAIDDLSDLAGVSSSRSHNNNKSLRSIIDMIHSRIAVLQKRVQDESKIACVEARKCREFSSLMDRAEACTREERKRCENAKRENAKVQKRAEELEDQLRQVRQVALNMTGITEKLAGLEKDKKSTDSTIKSSGKVKVKTVERDGSGKKGAKPPKSKKNKKTEKKKKLKAVLVIEKKSSKAKEIKVPQKKSPKNKE